MTQETMKITPTHLIELVEANQGILKFPDSEMTSIRMYYYGCEPIELANVIYFDTILGEATFPEGSRIIRENYYRIHMKENGSIMRNHSELELCVGDEIPVKFYKTLMDEYPVWDEETLEDVQSECIDDAWDDEIKEEVSTKVSSELLKELESEVVHDITFKRDEIEAFVVETIDELDYADFTRNLKSKLSMLNKEDEVDDVKSESHVEGDNVYVNVEAYAELVVESWKKRDLIKSEASLRSHPTFSFMGEE